ncbi:MAG TPA: hypothetical protein PLQ93_01200 [Bacteroidia bacterium]|nr:hypothetical protein [Bacteroidia bacterium]
MKKDLLLTVLAFITVLGMHAQDVSYTVKNDDPYDIRNLCISLDPFYADAWGTNANLGFGARADLYLWKLMSVSADFRRAYLDMNAREHVDGSLPKPLEELKKQLYLEAGAQLTFFERSKERDLKVVLSSSSSSSGRYTTTHTRYIMVPGTLRKVKQLRAGLISSRTAIDIQDAGEDPDNTFSAKQVGDTASFKFGPYGKSVDGSPIYGGYTMMNLYMVYGGISAKRITNLILDTDYGRKGNEFIYDFYLDVLYAPIIKFKNVYTVGGKEWEVSSSDVKNLGWRFGVSARRSVRSFMSYRMELGSRPGFVGGQGVLATNLYLMITFGWSIPIKIKALNPKG